MNEGQQKRFKMALAYADSGWRVLPWKYAYGTKRPTIPAWQTAATTDKDTIKQWWFDNPTSQIGIACGKESGLWVLDIDIKHGKNGSKSLAKAFGKDWFVELASKSCVQNSPSGGIHLFFKWNDNHPVSNTTELNGMSGIDTRGQGGWIGVAPSGYFINDEWQSYAWENLLTELPEAPDELYDVIVRHKERKGNASSGSEVDYKRAIEGSGIPTGSRNDDLFRIACAMNARSVSIEASRELLIYLNQRCVEPLHEEELMKILASSYGYDNKKNNDDAIASAVQRSKRIKEIQQEIKELDNE